MSLPIIPHYSQISHCLFFSTSPHTVPFYYFIFLHTIFQIFYSPSPSSSFLSSPYKVHSNNTCFSVSTSPHLHLSSSYFHVILSLPLTGKHPPLTILPTHFHLQNSFLGHYFICTYSFSCSVSLKPFSMLVCQHPLFYCRCASSRIPHSHSSLILPFHSSSLLSTR